MDRKSINVIIGGINQNGIKSATVQYRKYDEARTKLRHIAPDIADKLIKIIDDESYDLERRTAFLDMTMQEMCAGTDYSKCETIDDICHLFSDGITTRLGF